MEGLFYFDDDYRRINYQLKFPKQLLKNGGSHIVDRGTLRILVGWLVSVII